MPIKKVYSDEILTFIKENYKIIGRKACSEKTGLGTTELSNLVQKYQFFPKEKNNWTEEDMIFLKNNYFDMGAKKVAAHLGQTRQRVLTKAHRLGLKVDFKLQKQDLWNDSDISLLLDLTNPKVIYFWGFFWADGTIAKNSFNVKFKIVKPDFDCIAEFVRPLTPNWRYREDHDGDPNHQVQSILEINHKALQEFLEENDYHIKSGASACKILSKIPDHLKHYWWRGYFDGDGSFVFDGATVRASLVSSYDQDWTFAKYLEEKVKIGYRWGCNINEERKSSTINMEGEVSAKKFMDFILQGDQFGLQRKYDKYKDYLVYKTTVRPNKTSKYRGVNREKATGRWIMQIYKGKCIQKRFGREADQEILAAKEYDRMAKELFGNKAFLNFPNE